MPFDIETSHASPSGATLHLYVTKAKAPPRGVIQINHGLAERAARYARFAETMAALGFHVYAHDHRGHGATVAPDAPPRIFGNPDGASKVIADVAAIHDLIASEHPGLPVIVFGHSMGWLHRAQLRAEAFGAGAGGGDLERQLFGRPARPRRRRRSSPMSAFGWGRTCRRA